MSLRQRIINPIVWLTLIICLLILTLVESKAANYKFCISEKNNKYKAVVTLRNCESISGWNFYETDVANFVKIRLTKRMISGETDYRTASERFHKEIKRLIDEFKSYGLNEKDIYNIVDNDAELLALKKTKPGKKVVKKTVSKVQEKTYHISDSSMFVYE